MFDFRTLCENFAPLNISRMLASHLATEADDQMETFIEDEN